MPLKGHPHELGVCLVEKKASTFSFMVLPGTGKTELARVLARETGQTLFEISAEDSDGDLATSKQRLRAYCAAQAFLEKQGSLLLFDEAEDVFNDGSFWQRSIAQNHKAWMNKILENNPVPTLWMSNTIRGLDRAFLRRFDMAFEIPNPSKSQREKIIKNVSGGLLNDRTTILLAPAVVGLITD